MNWTNAKEIIDSIQNRHFSESGKVMQKLFALTLMRLNCTLVEERSVQGVDIDVVSKETGVKRSFEVKSSKGREVVIAKKDVEGLKSRTFDGYETFFAILCLPLCFSEGWIICPAEYIKEGKHKAIGLLRNRNDVLSKEVNDVFPEVLDEVGNALLRCSPGVALHYLKEQYKI